MTRDLQKAGLRTLAYAAVFGQGLTQREVTRFLVSDTQYTTGSVQKLWNEWLSQGYVQKRVRFSQKEHWRQALFLRVLARFVPWVQSIWVTGSLAAGTAQEKDDIDLLVITDRNRLWVSRLMLVGLSIVFGRARTRQMPEARVRDRWCFNMWLEEDMISLPSQLQTLYTAREVIQATPLYVRSDIRAEEFLEKNTWARQYFATGWEYAITRAKRVQSFTPFVPHFFGATWLNDWAWNWQKNRIMSTKTREVVEKNRALFHPRDTSSSVRDKYERICTLLGFKPYA